MKLDYEIYEKEYRGPLEGLLEVAREKDVPLSKINLSRMVKDFVNHLDHRPDWDLGQMSAPLLIFSELLRLKTGELLPQKEEEEEPGRFDEVGPESREFFVRVGKQLQEKAEQRARLYEPRPDLPEFVREGEKLYKEVTLFELIKAFQDILVTRKEPRKLPVYDFSDEFDTEEQMEKIKQLVRPTGSVGFVQILTANPTREEIVVTFIALLQLVKGSELRIVKQVDTDKIYIIAPRG